MDRETRAKIDEIWKEKGMPTGHILIDVPRKYIFTGDGDGHDFCDPKNWDPWGIPGIGIDLGELKDGR